MCTSLVSFGKRESYTKYSTLKKILCGIPHEIQTLQILHRNSTNYPIENDGKTGDKIIVIMPSWSDRPFQCISNKLSQFSIILQQSNSRDSGGSNLYNISTDLVRIKAFFQSFQKSPFRFRIQSMLGNLRSVLEYPSIYTRYLFSQKKMMKMARVSRLHHNVFQD